MGATVTLISNGKVTAGVKVLDVLTMCAADTVDTIILSVTIPAAWGAGSAPATEAGAAAAAAATSWTCVDGFKVAMRHQNAHAIVNAGFCMTMSQGTSGATIAAARSIFGGVGKVIFEATNLDVSVCPSVAPPSAAGMGVDPSPRCLACGL